MKYQITEIHTHYVGGCATKWYSTEIIDPKDKDFSLSIHDNDKEKLKGIRDLVVKALNNGEKK